MRSDLGCLNFGGRSREPSLPVKLRQIVASHAVLSQVTSVVQRDGDPMPQIHWQCLGSTGSRHPAVMPTMTVTRPVSAHVDESALLIPSRVARRPMGESRW
jgi:hypothetical protein